MNPQVRAYLIELARRDTPIAYSQLSKDLNLGLNTDRYEDREKLKKIMGDVSTYEHENGRPLLSSFLIYKDETKGHGGGFFELALQLGKIKKGEADREFYAYEEMARCRDFWRNESNYRNFVEVPTVQNQTTPSSYFTEDDLSFFDQWQGVEYDSENAEHIAAKNRLMDTVWEKTIGLGVEIIKRFPELKWEGGKYWNKRGTIKEFTWVKVLRPNHADKGLYFTFGLGADVEAFIFKIDCKFAENTNLTPEQIYACKSLIPSTAGWNEIPYSDLLTMSLQDLVRVSSEFIVKHLKSYDDIIEAVWNNASLPQSFQGQLVLREKPPGDFDEFPERERSFKGVEIDHEGRAKIKKERGSSGEELVKKLEIGFLTREKRPDLAEKVKIVKDGEGYDVYSFDRNGDEKFIEVKTTTGGPKTSFYLTHHELCFMRLKRDKYYIYRVYNFDGTHQYGDLFVIRPGVESQLLLAPTEYEVVLKK